MELTIKNTAGRVVRTLKIETWLYCLEKALYYNGYDMRKCYYRGELTMKQKDIRQFVIYLTAFTRGFKNQLNGKN